MLGCLCCLLTSTGFHLCCCHSKHVLVSWAKCDYAGIVSLQVGSFAAPIYYAFYCHPTTAKIYGVLVVLLGISTALISIMKRFGTPAFRVMRTALFACMGLVGVVPFFHHVWIYGWEMARHSFASEWVMMMAVWYLVGAVIYAFRIPERFFPGKLDLIGNGYSYLY